MGFHPTPQQGHCPCTHLADVVGRYCKQCAAVACNAQKHVYQETAGTLQQGCGTATPPTDWAAKSRRPDAVHPGKTKKDGEKMYFLSRPFLRFQCARGGRLFLSVMSVGQQIPWLVPFPAVFSPFGRKASVRPRYHFAYRVQGGTPCRGVQGLRKPLLRSFRFRRKLFVHQQNFFAYRIQGQCSWCFT